MRSFFLNRKLRRLEREGNDDLLQVLTLGPQYFSTPELHDLLERIQQQKEEVSAKLNRMYRLGAFTPVLMVATFLSAYFQWQVLAAAFFAGIPFLLGVYSYRSVQIRRHHPTFYDSDVVERLIRQELHRRTGSSIY